MTEDIYLSESSVLSYLPEIESIDGRIGDEVVRMFTHVVPPYFWIARASEDYHPPDERGLGGLWLHTKRTYTAYRMLEPTYRAMSVIDDYEANCARAAILLHDAFKYGQYPSALTLDDQPDVEDPHDYADDHLDHVPPYTYTGHDVDMAEFVREETRLPEEVARCVASHGGSSDWFSHEGPSPTDDLEMIVHTADCLASSQHHRLPVWQPHSKLLMMADPDMPTVDDEEWPLVDDEDQEE